MSNHNRRGGLGVEEYMIGGKVWGEGGFGVGAKRGEEERGGGNEVVESRDNFIKPFLLVNF